jgi:hypothetical protein
MRGIALAVISFVVLVLGANVAASADQQNFTAHLSGDEEVPPVDTNATGEAQFHLSDDGTAISYKLISANINNVEQAHIHCGPPGVNGSITVFLAGPFIPAEERVNGVLAEGTISREDVIPVLPSAACPGGIVTFDQLVEKMRSGGTYANIHTSANPNGEIRGQIK